MSDWIKLNIGGQVFHTTKNTLFAEPNSMLAKMFETNPQLMQPCNQDDQGNFLIDRSPRYFEPLLNYLRCGKLIIDPGLNVHGVYEEAKYYGVESVIPIIEDMLDALEDKEDPPLTRKEVVKILAATEGNKELRFQGLNLTGADLSRLDLRKINFKYAKMHGANLERVDLQGANLERVDLSLAVLDGAQLAGARMLCANLSDASMKNCNFEDGNMSTNMEGANLKNSVLEGIYFTADVKKRLLHQSFFRFANGRGESAGCQSSKGKHEGLSVASS